LEAIRNGAGAIKVLSFKNVVSLSEAEKLADALRDNYSVHSLDVSHNKLDREVLTALVSILKTTAVQSLNLDDCNLGDSEVSALATALTGSSLVTLRLDRAFIKANGMRNLTTALRRSTLCRLWLGSCSITPEQAETLAGILPETSVTWLSLPQNPLGDAGVRVLAAVLPSSSLKYLCLRNTVFGNIGAKALATVLAESNLEYLSINMNEDVTDEGGRDLLHALPHSAVDKLYVEGTRISNELLSDIRRVLKENEERTFVLQLTAVEETSSAVQLTCQTMAGTVAASVSWNREQHVKDLPDLVMTTMRSSVSSPARSSVMLAKNIKAKNLRFLLPNGHTLKVDKEATSLDEQLATTSINMTRKMQKQS
jgi:hypothetical protein